jgi:hypothetical protein
VIDLDATATGIDDAARHVEPVAQLTTTAVFAGLRICNSARIDRPPDSSR